MKGMPIKFRAKSYETGEYIYSSQVRQYEKALTRGYIGKQKVYDICQLVGYDAAGNEIYEGDKVNCYHTFCLPAEEFGKRGIDSVRKVKLVATVEGYYGENLNSPFDYQFLKKEVKK